MIAVMSRNFRSFLSSLPGTSRGYARGQLIFERDDPVDNLFVVDSGEVHLLRRQEDGAEFILQRATAGTVLAEASLTTPRYHCAAMAVSDAAMTAYPRAGVLNLIRMDSDVAMALVMHLGREVRNTRLRAEVASLRKVSDRLDAWLAWNDNRLPERGGLGQLAREIGVSAEALYRELAKRR
jgi:CRP/FNR family transcriptional regulator, dissimilatory nitrate respiration regulator